ncbi:MAG: hypothetical protein NTU49_04130 [Gammaproteobacteria bacterium]|nr:hypothetical protein [Gammaproteobacteria bacterium]
MKKITYSMKMRSAFVETSIYGVSKLKRGDKSTSLRKCVASSLAIGILLLTSVAVADVTQAAQTPLTNNTTATQNTTTTPSAGTTATPTTQNAATPAANNTTQSPTQNSQTTPGPNTPKQNHNNQCKKTYDQCINYYNSHFYSNPKKHCDVFQKRCLNTNNAEY